MITLDAMAVHATGLVALAQALAAATPAPSPEPAAATGPGIAGFLLTFALVVACIPLFLSMTRKVRGVRFRDADGGPDGVPDGAPDGGRDAAAPSGGRGGGPADRAPRG